MNTSALLFIVLIYWIFTLQSKIKYLEKIVNSLKDRLDTYSVPTYETKTEEHSTEVLPTPKEELQTYDEEKNVNLEPSRLTTKEPQSSVKDFKIKHEEIKTIKVEKEATKPSKNVALETPVKKVEVNASKEPSKLMNFLFNYFRFPVFNLDLIIIN